MTLLVANWKAAPETPALAQKLAKATLALAKMHKKRFSFAACIPDVFFAPVAKVAPSLPLGAQNVSAFTDVPHTGEVTAAMYKSLKLQYCLIGHSERRKEGETDTLIAQKAQKLLEKNIVPILCIGERERDEHGWYLSTIKDQLKAVFEKLTPEKAKKIIIAYEPVWAIGTAALREATPTECAEMVLFVRKVLTDMFGTKVASAIAILYGGSVDEKNAPYFITDGEADGLLFGRISLDAKRLKDMCAALSQKLSERTVVSPKEKIINYPQKSNVTIKRR
jgi:triosephosphate isomerase